MITKVPCPAVVKEYNKNMGGVDLLDSLLALYRIKIRSKKWYHRLVFHLLDMIIVTTWLLYRRDCEGTGMRKNEHMKLYTFKSYIAEALCKSGKSLERKKGRPCSTIAGEYEEKEKMTRCSNSSPWCAPGCHSPLDDYGWKEGEMQGTRVHRYTKSQVPEMWCSPLFYIYQQLLSEVSHRIGNQSMLCQKEKLWFKQYPKNHTFTHSHSDVG